MSFSWPWALFALLVIPLVLGIWWWSRRRRRGGAVRVTSIALVRAAAPGATRWRRRIPAALLVGGLGVLGIGAARPQATVPVPSTSATIMLAIDVSGSMCSTDVKPNRIRAAENAASDFVRAEAGGPRIGLVTFSTTATLLVPPTKNTAELIKALHGLVTDDATAIGEGIETSLNAIAQVDPSVAPTSARHTRGDVGGDASDAIILLTDGENNQGVDPQTAAREAAARGVRVYTIGFGTNNPGPLVCNPAQAAALGNGNGGNGNGGNGNGGNGGAGGFPGGIFGGPGGTLGVDFGALKQISATTGGTTYRAQDAAQLQAALHNMPGAFAVLDKRQDIATWFAGFGGLFIAAAVALSLWWNRVRRPAGVPGKPRLPSG